MAVNDPAAYGRDLACFDDADALFSDVTGIAVVKQDAYHRLTNDSVLGTAPGEAPNDATDNFGYDVTRLAGMRSDIVAGLPPVLSGVLQRDDRILTADVSIQQTNAGPNLTSGFVRVTCTTALGPFSLVIPIGQVTVAQFGGQTS